MSEEKLTLPERKSRVKVLEAQLLTAHARVMRWHALVTSGAYRFIPRQKMVDNEWVDLTDDEKLQAANETLLRHTEWMGELTEKIAEYQGGDLEDLEDGLSEFAASYEERSKEAFERKIRQTAALSQLSQPDLSQLIQHKTSPGGGGGQSARAQTPKKALTQKDFLKLMKAVLPDGQ